MIEDRSLSSARSACLDRGYPSSQKGGTLIAESILDRSAQEQCLYEPDRCRPRGCPRCGAIVHVHDRRSRHRRGECLPEIEVLRFRCADRKRCGATWLILPGFLCRCLWRRWEWVETALEGEGGVPVRTRDRWKARLRSSGRKLVTVLTTASGGVWSSLSGAFGLEATRSDVVAGYRGRLEPLSGRCFSELAALLHRLSPGVRLV